MELLLGVYDYDDYRRKEGGFEKKGKQARQDTASSSIQFLRFEVHI